MSTVFGPASRLLSTASVTWRSGLYGEPPRIVSNRTNTQFASVVGGETVNVAVAHQTGVLVTLNAGNISASAIVATINSALDAAYGTSGVSYAAVTGQTFYITDPISSSHVHTSGSSLNSFEKLGLPNVLVDNTLGSRTGVELLPTEKGTWYDQVSEPVQVPSGSTQVTLHLRLSASTSTPVSATLGSYVLFWDVAGYGGPLPYSSLPPAVISTGLPAQAAGSIRCLLSGTVLTQATNFENFNEYLPSDATSRISYVGYDPFATIFVVGSSEVDSRPGFIVEEQVPLGADRLRVLAINLLPSGALVPCGLSASMAFGARYLDR